MGENLGLDLGGSTGFMASSSIHESSGSGAECEVAKKEGAREVGRLTYFFVVLIY